jgi:hypothetical protein
MDDGAAGGKRLEAFAALGANSGVTIRFVLGSTGSQVVWRTHMTDRSETSAQEADRRVEAPSEIGEN